MRLVLSLMYPQIPPEMKRPGSPEKRSGPFVFMEIWGIVTGPNPRDKTMRVRISALPYRTQPNGKSENYTKRSKVFPADWLPCPVWVWGVDIESVRAAEATKRRPRALTPTLASSDGAGPDYTPAAFVEPTIARRRLGRQESP